MKKRQKIQSSMPMGTESRTSTLPDALKFISVLKIILKKKVLFIFNFTWFTRVDGKIRHDCHGA